MLPGFLESSYRKYKNDTATFIKWLSETAERCGSTSHPAQSSIQPSTQPSVPASKRLKGKARKEAKEAALKGESSLLKTPLDAAPAVQHTIAIKDLLPQAKVVASYSNPPIRIPLKIVQAGLRAISSRKRYAAWFKTQLAHIPSESLSNKRHMYFTDRLEEVLTILKPCCEQLAISVTGVPATGSLKTDSPSSKENNYDRLENLFAALDVEEPTEQPTAASSPSQDTTSPETAYSLEVSEDQHDMSENSIFAIFCLFDDLHTIRTSLQRTWTEYRIGKLDLVSASVTTNTAFELARRSEEDFMASYPSCHNYKRTTEMLLNQTPQFLELDNAKDYVELLGQWTFGSVYRILNSFCDVIEPGFVPLSKRGHFGIYNPLADRSMMSETEKSNQDLIILTEILPEFCLLEKVRAEPPAEDELTRGFRKMSKTKEIPIWLTFSAQIFLDIHHLLRGQISRGLDELQAVGNRAKLSLENYYDFSEDITAPATWPKGNDAYLRTINQTIEMWISKDVLLAMKRKNLINEGNLAIIDDPYYLFSHHPILCGLISFSIMLKMQQVGVDLVNAWGSVIYCAHLYNGLRQNCPPTIAWPDMDLVISMHTAERVFVGAAPETPKDCFKQACLFMGYSPESFARNRRQIRAVVSKKGPRGLKQSSPIAEIFRARYCDNKPVELTMYNVEALLNEQVADEQFSVSKGKSLHRQWKTSHKLTPLQLLEALKYSMVQEIPKVLFDYFAMHQECITLLRMVQTNLDDLFVKYLGRGYLDNESQLSILVLYIFMIATNSSNAAQELRIREHVGSVILNEAAEIVREFVKEQGDVEIKKVEKLCGNSALLGHV